MKRAFVYKDEKSNKFWWINYDGNDFAVNYGKNGTNGKYEIKEFDSEEDCQKRALKLIDQKIRKGYKEAFDFDFINRFYFDDEEIGPHRKTSHPNYAEHFKEDFYYDCGGEEAPFGNDEGSDALEELAEHIKKFGNHDIALLPRKIVEEYWDMDYFEPNNFDVDYIKEQVANENEGYFILSDQVIIAIALGQIKITGTIEEELKKLALLSLKKMGMVSKIIDWDISEVVDITIRDLNSFKIFA
jgi:uncharacterized protein YfeS